MTLIPQRTVASQIAAQLRANIENETWRGWLPTERALCQSMEASRNTVRAAISQLKAEGLVVTERPIGSRIVRSARTPRQGSAIPSVGMIVPEPSDHLRPFTSLWIEELRTRLGEEKHPLRIYTGHQYYRSNPARALERLVTQNMHEIWVPVLSSRAMQQWFARRELSCLVAGSVYSGIDLPCFDMDYGAICRHAAAALIRLGHRRIALLNHRSLRAGESASDAGFLEAVRQSRHPEISAEIAYHGDDVESVGRALRRLRDSRHGLPTGIVVNSSSAYLATVTLLAGWRLRVPEDVSLISRDDDPLLNFIHPAPARYTVSPQAFARKLIGPVLRLLRGLPVPHPPTFFLPQFYPGASLTSPASPA